MEQKAEGKKSLAYSRGLATLTKGRFVYLYLNSMTADIPDVDLQLWRHKEEGC